MNNFSFKGLTAVSLALSLSFGLAASAVAQTTFGISGAVDTRLTYLNQSNICLDADKVPTATSGRNVALGGILTPLDCNTPNEYGGLNDLNMFVDGAELVFKAQHTTDTQVSFGVKYEINMDSTLDGGNVKADEVVGYVASSWGRVEFGYEDGAESSLAVNGYVPGGSGNIDGGAPTAGNSSARKTNWGRVKDGTIANPAYAAIDQQVRAGLLANPATANLPEDQIVAQVNAAAAQAGVTPTARLTTEIIAGGFAPRNMDLHSGSGDAAKISYYTPSFAGLVIGLSYAPARADEGDKIDHLAGVGIKYSDRFGDVDVDSALVASIAYKNVTSAVTGKDNTVVPYGAKFGTKFGWNGLNAGLGAVYNANSHGAVSGPGTCDPARKRYLRDFEESECADNIAFNVSLGYDFGAGSIGAGFLMGMAFGALYADQIPAPDANPANAQQSIAAIEAAYEDEDNYGTDTYMAFGLGVDYAVVDGLKVYADFVYSIDDVATKASNTENDKFDSNAIGVVVGSKVSF